MDQFIQRYNTNEQTDKNGSPTSTNAVAYSPDGNLLVSASYKHVLIYNAANFQFIKHCRAHTDTVYCLAFAKDGKVFASGG